MGMYDMVDNGYVILCTFSVEERVGKRGKTMLQTIESINAAVNDFVWGVPAMVCIIGVGLVLSFRTGFIQFRRKEVSLRFRLSARR